MFSFNRLKLGTLRTALLAMIVYMLNRAISSLVYPGDSQILQNASQSEFKILELVDIYNVTDYISNSVLFPLLLVVLYKLTDLNIGKWILGVLGLHYASVVAVSIYFGYMLNLEYLDFLEESVFYKDEEGQIYSDEELRYSTPLRPYVEYEDGVPIGILKENEDVSRLVETEHRFSFIEFLAHFYSLIAATLLLMIGAGCLPALYRLEGIGDHQSSNTTLMEAEATD